MGHSPYITRPFPFGPYNRGTGEKGLESPHVGGYMLSINS